MIPVSGGDERQLTHDKANDFGLEWSPDGQTIAFVSDRENSTGDIWTISAAGGTAKRLTTQGACFGPNFSADGTAIIYASSSTADGQAHLWMVPADGGAPKQLTKMNYEAGAVYAPDGMSVAFNGHDGKSFDLYVMEIAGGQATRLTDDPTWEVGARWSPDGNKIAFLSNKEGNYEVYVMPAGGGEATRMTTSAGDESAIWWSPDANSIVYSLNEGNTDLWTINLASVLASMPQKEVTAK